jgi:hypothetical protein
MSRRDPRFRTHYEEIAEGLADYASEATLADSVRLDQSAQGAI